MKKILFFGYYFYPSSEIGAVRISELALRLSCKYDVTVVLKEHQSCLPKEKNLHYLFYNNEKHPSQPEKKHNNNQFGRIPSFLKECFRTIKNIIHSFNAYKTFKKNFNGDLSQYDCVIGSYGPLCNLLCANYVKKVKKNVLFIADFRDPMTAPIIPSIFIPYMRLLQNRICKKADIITAVSKGYGKMISTKKTNNKIHIVTNGYSSLIPNDELPDSFSFLCVGSLYNGKRRIDSLLKALRELVDEQKIEQSILKFQYIGSDFVFFKKQVEQYGFLENTKNLGKISREDCLSEERKSYFLLLPTWNKKNYIGVIPGKFYEYISVKRKIISICIGNLGESELSHMIKDTSTGFSIEQDTDKRLVKKYIEQEYHNFAKKIYPYSPQGIDKYNYDNIITQIQELIESD